MLILEKCLRKSNKSCNKFGVRMFGVIFWMLTNMGNMKLSSICVDWKIKNLLFLIVSLLKVPNFGTFLAPTRAELLEFLPLFVNNNRLSYATLSTKFPPLLPILALYRTYYWSVGKMVHLICTQSTTQTTQSKQQ